MTTESSDDASPSGYWSRYARLMLLQIYRQADACFPGTVVARHYGELQQWIHQRSSVGLSANDYLVNCPEKMLRKISS